MDVFCPLLKHRYETPVMFRFLFLCKREDWCSKLDRNRFASFDAIKILIEAQQGRVFVSGPGWSSWNTARSVFENVVSLGEPWFDLVLMYNIEESSDVPSIRVITCNELYKEKHTSAHLSNKPSYLILHHTNEASSLPAHLPLYHLPHCADETVFYDDGHQRKYDIALVGNISSTIYPLRKKIEHVLETHLNNLRVNVHKHPGYKLKNPDAAVKEYADVLRDSKIVASCSSKYFYRLSKFAEIPLCGAVLATDMPKDGASFFRKFAVELSMDDSEKTIAAKLRRALTTWESTAKIGKELSQKTSLQKHYAARFMDTYDAFCKDKTTCVRPDDIAQIQVPSSFFRHTSKNPWFAALYTLFCRLLDKPPLLVCLSDGTIAFDTKGVPTDDPEELIRERVPELINAKPVVQHNMLVGLTGSIFWSDPLTLVRIPFVNMRTRRVLMVADSDMWCWHYKAVSVAKYCQGPFRVDIVYTRPGYEQSKVYTDSLLDGYDHVHFFAWWNIPQRVFDMQEQGLLSLSTTMAATNWFKDKQIGSFLNNRCGIVAVSPYLAELCETDENIDNNLVFRCYNGVDTSIFVPSDRPTSKRVVKVLMCNKTINKFTEKNDSHGLLIAERVQSLLSDIPGMEVTLHLARHGSSNLLNQEQMVRLYQDHDIYVFCGRHHLGTPNTAFEAAACGCALVCTANGCLPALFESTSETIGALTELPVHRSKPGGDDVQDQRVAMEIVSKVRHLSKNIASLNKIRKNARDAVVNQWSWKTRAKAYNDVFDLRCSQNVIKVCV